MGIFYLGIVVVAGVVIRLALGDDKKQEEEPWEEKLREIKQKHEEEERENNENEIVGISEMNQQDNLSSTENIPTQMHEIRPENVHSIESDLKRNNNAFALTMGSWDGIQIKKCQMV